MSSRNRTQVRLACIRWFGVVGPTVDAGVVVVDVPRFHVVADSGPQLIRNEFDGPEVTGRMMIGA